MPPQDPRYRYGQPSSGMPYGPPPSQLPPFHPPGQPYQAARTGPQTLFSGPNIFAAPGGPANRPQPNFPQARPYQRQPIHPTVHGAAVHPRGERRRKGILLVVGLLVLIGGALYGLTVNQETDSDGSEATELKSPNSDSRSEDSPGASPTDPADTPPNLVDAAPDRSTNTNALSPDAERKADIDALEKQIIAVDTEFGNYPISAEINDEAWRRRHMKNVDTEIFKDPESKTTRLAEKPTKNQYAYQLGFDVQLAPCRKEEVADCTYYAVSAVLSDGSVYRKASF